MRVSDRLAISKVASFGRANALDNSGFAASILEFGKPLIKGGRTNDGIHDFNVSEWIRSGNI